MESEDVGSIYAKGDQVKHESRWNGWGWKEKRYPLKQIHPDFFAYLKKKLNLDEPGFQVPGENKLFEIKIADPSISKGVLRQLQSIAGEKHVKIDHVDRLTHSYGKSLPDVLALRFGSPGPCVDAVVYPRTTAEIIEILQLASANKFSVIPAGGASSVTGGLSPQPSRNTKGAISLDMSRMNKMLEFDETSQSALFEAGIYGPLVEKKLNERGFTLGHFPQSFEFSTLGGWIATRGAGQESDGYGKIEEMLISLQAVTPSGASPGLAGIIETGYFPESAAGPDLNRIFAGSEGVMGVITAARVKIRKKPEVIAGAALVDSFEEGLHRIRRLRQSQTPVNMVRLSDENETDQFLMMRSANSSGEPNEPNKPRQPAPGKSWKDRFSGYLLSAKRVKKPYCLLLFSAAGERDQAARSYRMMKEILCSGSRAIFIGEKPAEEWRKSRFELPYLRHDLLNMGVGADTYETAVPWSAMESLRNNVYAALQSYEKKSSTKVIAMVHISHSNANGACLYFTVLYRVDFNQMQTQWLTIKECVTNAIVDSGGTLSHHHGVGLDHKPWVAREIGENGVALLRGIKAKLDPKNIMNPGKLL